ncbi:hypothetical protein [Vallitalea guaymasensis]|uniref:hypothetical protein n=1 Tax=Vallitalea guaymasensis TaxID=1185412 RepID=UPI000DE47AD4|nr:hypothetical protein [Vallitalea guaymasensis]
MKIRKLLFLTLIIISILTACSSNLEDNKIESSDNSIDSNDSEDVTSTLIDENKGPSESNIDSDKGEIASKSLIILLLNRMISFLKTMMVALLCMMRYQQTI